MSDNQLHNEPKRSLSEVRTSLRRIGNLTPIRDCINNDFCAVTKELKEIQAMTLTTRDGLKAAKTDPLLDTEFDRLIEARERTISMLEIINNRLEKADSNLREAMHKATELSLRLDEKRLPTAVELIREAEEVQTNG